jgi:putative addiction module CopG family antidote
MVLSALPPEYEQFVQNETTSGRYGSAEEVVCVALRELQRRQRLAELQQEVDAGMKQLDRGEGIKIENEAALQEFFTDIATRGEQRLNQRNQA